MQERAPTRGPAKRCPNRSASSKPTGAALALGVNPSGLAARGGPQMPSRDAQAEMLTRWRGTSRGLLVGKPVFAEVNQGVALAPEVAGDHLSEQDHVIA